MNVGYVLENVAKFNEEAFSVITFSKDWKFSYNLLELSYKLSVGVYWFGEYWRRREEEQITVFTSECNVIIPEDEIHSLPYFKKNLKTDAEEVNAKTVVDFRQV